MNMYLGDFAEDLIIHFLFTTNNKNGAAIAPLSAFEAADLKIYKNGSATEKTTTNGITMTSPFDSITGLHAVDIDTSNDTGDAGFWVAGADYIVVLNPDTETIDGEVVVAVLATFSIQNRYMRGTDSAAIASICTETRLAKLDATISSRAVAGDEMDLVDSPNSTAVAVFIDAILARTGITEGGTWTVEKALKVINAWVAGNWRLKEGETDVQELLDPDDGETVILEQELSLTTPYRVITVKI